jgi:hypothetical protein
MRIVLHELLKRDDGAIQLLLSFGDEPARTFLASYDVSDPRCSLCSVDNELFMRLSDLSHKRFGSCAVYQMELMGIISAFEAAAALPELPATLGTTGFCTLKPGPLRILRNKVWILLYRLGLCHPDVWVHPDYQVPGS